VWIFNKVDSRGRACVTITRYIGILDVTLDPPNAWIIQTMRSTFTRLVILNKSAHVRRAHRHRHRQPKKCRPVLPASLAAAQPRLLVVDVDALRRFVGEQPTTCETIPIAALAGRWCHAGRCHPQTHGTAGATADVLLDALRRPSTHGLRLCLGLVRHPPCAATLGHRAVGVSVVELTRRWALPPLLLTPLGSCCSSPGVLRGSRRWRRQSSGTASQRPQRSRTSAAYVLPPTTRARLSPWAVQAVAAANELPA
jgi:hypothetical protein